MPETQTWYWNQGYFDGLEGRPSDPVKAGADCWWKCDEYAGGYAGGCKDHEMEYKGE